MSAVAQILGEATGYVAAVVVLCYIFAAVVLVSRRLIHGEWFV